jgi:prophage regulatory protein
MLRVSEVMELLGLSESQIYTLVREKSFPRPVKLGAASRWRESTVFAWLETREQAS